MVENNTYIHKPFLQTLYDSVSYFEFAKETENIELVKLLSKSCIIHCSFSVEALANNMIQFLSFNKSFADAIEKMDVLSKFEFFAMIVKEKKLNRGLNHFQVFTDLVKIRNNYVHPKIIKSKLFENKKNELSSEEKNYNHINISCDSENWNLIDAEKCVRSLLIAIDDFLINDLGMENKSLSCMFLDSVCLIKNSGPIVNLKEEWGIWCEKELQYRPKFYMDFLLTRYK